MKPSLLLKCSKNHTFLSLILVFALLLCGCTQANTNRSQDKLSPESTTIVEPSPESTPEVIFTATPTPTESPSPTPKPTDSPTPTPSPSPSPTPTPTPVPTVKKLVYVETVSWFSTTTNSFEYDDQGVMIHSTSTVKSNYGDSVSECFYDSLGRLSHYKSEDKSSITISDYLYDGLNAEVTIKKTDKSTGEETVTYSKRTLDDRGNVVYDSDSLYDYYYEFDENNNKTGSTTIRKSDSYVTHSLTEYDELGRQTRLVGYDANNQITYENITTYSIKDGKLIRETTRNGILNNTSVIDLDEEGDIIRIEEFDSFGQSSSVYTYKYDYIPIASDSPTITPTPTSGADKAISPTPTTLALTPIPTATPTRKPTPKPTATPTPQPRQLTGRLDYGGDDCYVYYVVNINTGRFHKPNCSSIGQMNSENARYATDHGFADRSAARSWIITMGYAPCQRCNP